MKNLREKFRKIDFLIPIVFGVLISFWAFEKKDYFGVFITSLAAIIFANTRWKWVYQNNDDNKNIKNSRKKLNQVHFFEFKRLTYMFFYILLIPVLLVLNAYLSLNYKGSAIVSGMLILYVVTFCLRLIYKLTSR